MHWVNSPPFLTRETAFVTSCLTFLYTSFIFWLGPCSELKQKSSQGVYTKWKEYWKEVYSKMKDFTPKGSALKGMNLLPVGSNSFLLEWKHFQKGETILAELLLLEVHNSL